LRHITNHPSMLWSSLTS